jgi:hypothetical protein
MAYLYLESRRTLAWQQHKYDRFFKPIAKNYVFKATQLEMSSRSF